MKTRLLLVCFMAFLVQAFAQEGVRWVETNAWNGYGMLQTEAFSLVGDKWEINYTSKNLTNAVIEMIDAETGAIIHQINHQPQKQNTSTYSAKCNRKAKRSVYLRISGESNGWTLKLSQYVNDITSFEIYQQKKTVVKMKKYGMWCGEGGDEVTIPINVPFKHWKIKATTEDQGSFIIKCKDSNGQLFAETFIFKAGTIETWIHAEGDITIKATSVATPWTLAIESMPE